MYLFIGEGVDALEEYRHVGPRNVYSTVPFISLQHYRGSDRLTFSRGFIKCLAIPDRQ